MIKLEPLTGKQMSVVQGGRDVVKMDLNGDGEWDVKFVTTKNRQVVKYRNGYGPA